MKGRNIGRGVSIWLEFGRREAAMHEDVDAFNAPSECHGLVARGEEARARSARRHVEGVTGLKWRVFCREVRARTNGRVAYFRCGL